MFKRQWEKLLERLLMTFRIFGSGPKWTLKFSQCLYWYNLSSRLPFLVLCSAEGISMMKQVMTQCCLLLFCFHESVRMWQSKSHWKFAFTETLFYGGFSCHRGFSLHQNSKLDLQACVYGVAQTSWVHRAFQAVFMGTLKVLYICFTQSVYPLKSSKRKEMLFFTALRMQ